MKILVERFDSNPWEPDYDELDDDTVTVDLALDGCTIIVDNDGSWSFEESYDWLDRPSGGWSSDEYNADVIDTNEVLDNLADMLMMLPQFPEEAGRYRLTGFAILYYTVKGLYSFRDSSGYDKVEEDGAEVYFDEENSDVENVKFIKV